MKMKQIIGILIFSFMLFSACKKDLQEVEAGVYVGVLPCGDCIGIDNKMTLNVDGTFVLETMYKGKGDGKVFKETGNYTVENGQLVLALVKSPYKYKIGDNYIELLDIDGNKIDSQLNYKLVKQD